MDTLPSPTDSAGPSDLDLHIQYYETALITHKLTSGGRQPLSQKILEDYLGKLKKRKAEAEQGDESGADQTPDV